MCASCGVKLSEKHVQTEFLSYKEEKKRKRFDVTGILYEVIGCPVFQIERPYIRTASCRPN